QSTAFRRAVVAPFSLFLLAGFSEHFLAALRSRGRGSQSIPGNRSLDALVRATARRSDPLRGEDRACRPFVRWSWSPSWPPRSPELRFPGVFSQSRAETRSFPTRRS